MTVRTAALPTAGVRAAAGTRRAGRRAAAGGRAAALLGGLLLIAWAAAATAPAVLAAPRTAPESAALGRQPARPPQPKADAHRVKGAPITGGPRAAEAAPIAPGQYVDSIGPGQTRWYAAVLDAAATDDLSVTAVPKPGVPVDYGDGVELTLTAAGAYGFTCDSQSVHFGQDEGAMALSGAVSRIPTHDRDTGCDKAGRYLLSMHRTSAAASDQARWPVELRFDAEAPLPAGTVPAAASTDYGPAPAPLTGTPKDVAGGAGFDDAARVTTGVWRDRVLPARTRYYKVHVGWGQQLTYSADFANEPASVGTVASTFVATSAYAPDRLPVEDASNARDSRPYDGSPAGVGLGTVPVAWTNRWVNGEAAHDVHQAGDYWIAVGLGPAAARLAPDTAVGVVLRVQVTGDELAGPQYQAPPLAGGHGKAAVAGARATGAGSPAAATPGSDGSAHSTASPSSRGITGTDMIAAATGGAVALAGVGATALAQRGRSRTDRRGRA